MIGILIFFICSEEVCLSQRYEFDDPTRWIHFTTESGLPSNDVAQIFEGSNGTMWSSTPHGISWFDGFEWRPILSDSPDNQLPPGGILGEIKDSLLVHGSDGSLYIGNRVFRKLPVENVDDVALLHDSLIIVRKQEQLWQFKNNHLSLYHHPDKSFPSRVFLLIPVRKGTAFLDATSGLCRFTKHSITFMFNNSRDRVGLNFIQENKSGNGIISIKQPSISRGVWSWDSSGNLKQEKTEGKDAVVAVGIGENNERFVVYKSGLVRRSVSGNWETVYEDPKLRKTNSMFIGSDGDVWFATSDGIYVYRQYFSRWKYWKRPPPDFKNTTNEILRTRDGKIWVATANGIDIHDEHENIQTIEKINGEPLFVVTGLAQDSSGNVWISSGSSFMGTYRWDGRKWEYFNPWDSSEQVWIHKIVVDARKRIWFLGLGKYSPRHGTKQPGAYMYEHGRFTHYGEQDGLLSGRVYSFAYAPDSSVWFGTYKGITHLKNGNWKHWTTKELNVSRVFTIALSRSGCLWYGDNDFIANGLGCITPDGTMKQYTIDDGLLNNNIWDIEIDRHENIWISTQSGISCFSNESFINYDEHSGLKSSGGNWPILPLEDNVYVGTTGEGVAILKRNVEMTPPPRIIFDSPIIEEHSALVRWKALAFFGELSPEDIPTRYRLNHGTWSAWSKTHEVTLKGLEHGEYIIQVQSKGLLGAVNTEGNLATFTIAPPVYLRPIFYYPAGATFILVSVLLFMLQFSKIRRRKELAVSEEKFRAVATNTASAILVFEEKRFLFANHSAETMTEFTHGELMNKSFWEIIHPEMLDEIEEFMKKWLTETSVPRRFECKILTKNYKTKWLDVTAARIRFMNTVAVIVSAFDITEKKKAEESLRESEERYRIITELVADYAYLDRIEEDGTLTVLWITESLYRLTGYTVEEMKAPGFFQHYVHPDDIEEALMYMQKLLTGESVSHDVRVRKKDGTVIWVHNESRPIWNDTHTRVAFIYGAAHDITQRKLDEEQKRALTSELIQTEERERRRMAVYLHDIIGHHLAEGKLRLREIMKSEISDGFTKQLEELRHNLDNAIKDSRALTFELSPPALQDVSFDLAVKFLAEQLMSKHNINLRIEHDEQSISLEPQMKVLLYYAIRELFFNVIKHAHATEVKLCMSRNETEFRITIEDNGTGFDVQEALTRTKGDSGFGLKNVYERMEHIGAKFDIISAPLKGTRVIIAVPMKRKRSET
ncbi:MAG: PAS domain S-box protein [Ignavibacteriae bacterium]|nr:PAS domain S-box protein [Ignavibacteriota bacterium]